MVRSLRVFMVFAAASAARISVQESQHLELEEKNGQERIACEANTGGTCGFSACYSWRSAECVDGQCLCPDGTCAVDGFCRTAPAWAIQEPEPPAGATEFILPSDDRLAYIGRFSHEGAVSRHGWAATQVIARFTGASISANLSGSATGDRYLPVIDGQPGLAFRTGRSAGWETHVLADGLPAGEHILALWKISEDEAANGEDGVAAFGGLSAEAFGEAPAVAARRLEFIGDSDTAGFCVDQRPGWTVDSSTAKWGNAYETWAARIAREFGADMVQEAVSGYGVTWMSGGEIQRHLVNVLPFSDRLQWDFSSWVPDAVVILIGPNDQRPNSQSFSDAYTGMLEQVAANYASAAVKPKLIQVCGGSTSGLDPCDAIQRVTEQFNQGRSDGFRGYYTSIAIDHWHAMNGPGSRTNGYKSCMGHYSPQGHEVLAGDIIPQIADIMDWNVTRSGM